MTQYRLMSEVDKEKIENKWNSSSKTWKAKVGELLKRKQRKIITKTYKKIYKKTICSEIENEEEEETQEGKEENNKENTKTEETRTKNK